MTPSTPPRSRSGILFSHQLQPRQKLDESNSNNNNNNIHSDSALNDNIYDDDGFFLSNLPRKPQVPPETPKKNTGLDIPMTPSTILHRSYNNTNGTNRLLFKYDKSSTSYNNRNNNTIISGGGSSSNNNNVLLAPPLPKFNGLRSPEFSPMRRLSIIPSDNDTNNNDSITEDEDVKINKNNVNRVLFPISLSSDDDDSSDNGDGDNDNELFAPSTPPSKVAKNCPGTPSHQIITLEQAKEWNNESYLSYNKTYGKEGGKNREYGYDSDDDNDSDFICEAKLENPFITSFSSSQSPVNSRPLSKKERLERHQKLIKENPDIENVISYVNKRGEISKRRVLTSKEKKRFKPRALIFKDDDDSGNE